MTPDPMLFSVVVMARLTDTNSADRRIALAAATGADPDSVWLSSADVPRRPKPVFFADLWRPKDCQFPLGNSSVKCGAEVLLGSSYCGHHDSLCLKQSDYRIGSFQGAVERVIIRRNARK